MTNDNARPDYRNLSTIVVENNAIIRDIVRQVLHDIEVGTVTFTRSAEQGLEAFSVRPCDFVIAELSKESGNGLAMLETLRKSDDPKVAATPFILLSSYPHMDTVLRAREAGADALVAEPFSPKTLVEHIDTILLRHQESEAESEAPASEQAPAVE